MYMEKTYPYTIASWIPKLIIMADFLMHEAQQPIIVTIFIMQSSYFLKGLAQI